jgi:hypothetical protein|tara:strand:+ start:265 stop:405 length:141 start_codon:yes stop_codon:yes gene_type:complete
MENHKRIAKSSYKRLLANPFSSRMTSFVIAIASIANAGWEIIYLRC